MRSFFAAWAALSSERTEVGSTKKLQVNMANIRRKLGSRPGHNNYIMNELGVGYRMIDADHDGPDAPADHEENA